MVHRFCCQLRDAASADTGWVGDNVQRSWTVSKVLRPHANALQPHVGRERGDRGDGGDNNQLLLIYAAVVTGTPSAATRKRLRATSTSTVPNRVVQIRLNQHGERGA